jgi:DNA-binding IclR family transcriptional regulator
MAQAMQGSQVVSRVAAILRQVSLSPGGARTSELAAAVGLTRPTAHRLLRSLAAEGYVELDPTGTLWVLGPELFVMGTIAAARHDVADLAAPAVQRLAALTGESAFLSVRRGDETVCLLREEGSFPVRSFVLYEGVRFPLGVASAGLAILSFLPTTELDSYLTRAMGVTATWGETHSETAIRDRVAETRQRGFAVNPGLIVEGSWGIGAAVFDARERPVYALSLTGIEPRFTTDRLPALGRALLAEAHQLSRRLGASAP